MNKNFLLSLVTPVYNEECTISLFFDKLSHVLNIKRINWELIFVNDGSVDSTLEKLMECQKTDQRITIINLSRNFGKEAALSAGLQYSNGDAVIPLDVDLQDPPELIVRMLQEWQKGADVVLARRKKRLGDSYFKRCTAALFYFVINKISIIKIPSNIGDFRLMDRKVVNHINRLHEKNRMMKGLFAWVGFNQRVIMYDRPRRQKGNTTFNYGALIHLACDGVIGFSTLPLRLPFYIAILLFCTLCVVLLCGGAAITTVIILLLSSLHFFVMGIFGEYIARILDEVRGRPLYIVKDIYKNHKNIIDT